MEKIVSSNLSDKVQELLKGLRAMKNYSQRMVFLEVGVDVSKHEVGTCSPKFNTIRKLCNLYGIRLAGFIAVCEEYECGRIDIFKALEILDQWLEYDQVLKLAIGMFTKEKKAG